MHIESVMPSNHLILCRPLLLLPSIIPSIRVFSKFLASGGQSIGVSALASVRPMNIHNWSPLGWTGWISLQSKGTLKSLLQHHSSKAPILQHSAFFTVQLSLPYMTTGKTTALTRQTFVRKVMSLLFNMLPRLVITFLPKNKLLIISWLQSPSAVLLSEWVSEITQSCPTFCDPMDCSLLTRLLPPWDSPGQSTGVGCHLLLQGIFSAQRWNPGLPHSRRILYCWATTEAHLRASLQSTRNREA